MITLEKARMALVAAENRAKDLGVAVSTVIVDEHGTLITMSRMDGAFYISPRFAETKAFTSAMIGMPSGDIAAYAEAGKPYFGINTLFAGALTPLAGGLPVFQTGAIVGGVGVGGSTDAEQDVACAQEAKKVLEA